MTTFTITTPVNIDSLSTKTGSDVYNINGGYLTVDQDTRYGLNNVASACMGNTTISASLGGTILYDARKVRLIPYNSGSGNVPAYNTTISQGSASGLLIGVYSALNVAPTTPGSAMPASGYIKIKQWNDVAYAAGALTGIGASATGVDVVGWLEIVGVESTTQTVPRLGTWLAYGDYYEIGTTDGNNATSYQIPSNGSSAFYLPGVQVETSSGSGVYEWWPAFGTKTSQSVNLETSTYAHNNVCWIGTTGLLRFQNDGTNSGFGNLPGSGRKIRIPNLFFMNCTSGTQTANVAPNAAPATRHDFTTTSAGSVEIDKVSMAWYPSFSAAYSVDMQNSAIFDYILFANHATAFVVDNICVGQSANIAAATAGLTINQCLSGGTIDNSVITKASLSASGYYVLSITDSANIIVTNSTFAGHANRANTTTGTVTATRLLDSSFIGCSFFGGRIFLVTPTNVLLEDSYYIDNCATKTLIAQAHGFCSISTGALSVMIDGLTWPDERGPYTDILGVSAGCDDVVVRNIGTLASPLNAGGTIVEDAAWTRVTTTATVTKVGHGLVTGMGVYVYRSDVTAAISIALKTITVTGADTFTFACTNSGATSGVLSYFPAATGRIITGTGSGASRGVRVQRVYMKHLKEVIVSTFDNTNDSLLFENVHNVGNHLSASTNPVSNNCFINGYEGRMASTGLTSVYGYHFAWNYLTSFNESNTSVSWSRSSTTATVTKSNHGLVTGDFINVKESSATLAIIPGVKTVTAINKDTFTFTCLNASSTSGTLDYDVCSAMMRLFLNEATSVTINQIVVDAGTPKFTSAGGVYMPTVGDKITFITPKYIKGLSGFEYIESQLTGGGAQTNFNINYQIDKNDGSGYSSWKKLQYCRAGGSGSSGATTFTVTDATGVANGMYVYGTGINNGAVVTNVASNTVTVDRANVAAVSGIIRFSELPAETGLDEELGTKMKIQIETITTNSAAITHFLFYCLSDTAGRVHEYPLDLATLTLTGLQSGSDIVILEPGTDTEYINVDANGSTSYDFEYDAGLVSAVDIGVFKTGYVPFYIRNLSVTADGGSVPVAQIADRNYVA